MKHTQYRGLVLDTNSDIFKFDAYPDSEFAGMYGHKNPNDLACSKSHTGFIITFDDCTLFLISKLQYETSLSTMKA